MQKVIRTPYPHSSLPDVWCLPLAGGEICLIDADVVPMVKDRSWCLCKSGRKQVRVRSSTPRKGLGSTITGKAVNFHRNGDPLDFRRANLTTEVPHNVPPDRLPYFSEPDGCHLLPLTQGKVAKIDSSEADRLKYTSWFFCKGGRYSNVYSSARPSKALAVVITGSSKMSFHANGDPLDFRKVNLKETNEYVPDDRRPRFDPSRGWIVPLTNGLEAMIDEIDASRVGGYLWCGNPRCRVVTTCESYGIKNLCLNRFVMNAGTGDVVDYIDGNYLNCRRDNLCITTFESRQPYQDASGNWRINLTRGKVATIDEQDLPLVRGHICSWAPVTAAFSLVFVSRLGSNKREILSRMIIPRKDQQVHHINDDESDLRRQNLVLYTKQKSTCANEKGETAHQSSRVFTIPMAGIWKSNVMEKDIDPVDSIRR